MAGNLIFADPLGSPSSGQECELLQADFAAKEFANPVGPAVFFHHNYPLVIADIAIKNDHL